MSWICVWPHTSSLVSLGDEKPFGSVTIGKYAQLYLDNIFSLTWSCTLIFWLCHHIYISFFFGTLPFLDHMGDMSRSSSTLLVQCASSSDYSFMDMYLLRNASLSHNKFLSFTKQHKTVSIQKYLSCCFVLCLKTCCIHIKICPFC